MPPIPGSIGIAGAAAYQKNQSLPADPPDERGRADRDRRQRGGEEV